MSSSFPLLRLPRLVLFEVFKSLSIGEKIKLSFCSKKSSTQINNARLYSQKVLVCLDMYHQKIEVFSENNKDKFEIYTCSDIGTNNNPHIQRCQIGGHTVPVMPSRIRITSFWRNLQEGYLSVTRHLLKMFQCKITTSVSCYRSGLFYSTISMLFERKQEFKTLTIKLDGSEDQNLLWSQISNKFELVEDLEISSIVDPDLTPILNSWPQKITISNSAWFTLEYLLTCTCTRIFLMQSDLKNKDLDEMLKNWKAGGFPNLEYLKIYSDNIGTSGTPILGMNLRELNGKVIQTNDGLKKATIRNHFGITEMSVTVSQ